MDASVVGYRARSDVGNGGTSAMAKNAVKGDLRLSAVAWKEEVERVLAAQGLPYRVNKSWVEQSSPLCCALLADVRTGGERLITIAADRFPTLEKRRAEIVRQLQPERRKSDR